MTGSTDLHLIDNDEAARRLGTTAKALRVMRAKGGGPPYVKLGRSVRYRPGDIEEYLDARTVDPAGRVQRTGRLRLTGAHDPRLR